MLGAGVDLAPYVPRLLLEWAAAEPSSRWRVIDGTLVFVDLSGFTRLSERLARRGGRAGAEDLTAVLDQTFAELLTVAASFGGSMLKYGGDALLIFFWDDGHPLRATAAAAAMRADLRARSPVSTPAGPVVLRMSIGVHSGMFHFFLAGASHRELVVAGPEATATVAMEGAASAGQIVVSPATAAHLPAHHVGRPIGPGVLVRGNPMADAAAPAAIPSGVDPTMFIPVALRHHLLGGGHDPEHRQAAIGFTHFVGFDALLVDEGPDVAAAELDNLFAGIHAAFDPLGVCFLSTDLYDDGGKVISTAGAPDAATDDDDRLLRALRALHDEAGGRLRLRSGVHRGAIFAGDIGAPFRRTYTVIGDAVNTAARVMARAGPGQILATPDILGRAVTRFATTPIAPFAAKGKSKPLRAEAVGAVMGRHEVATTGPIVGREPERARLRAAIADLGRGSGAAFALEGPAGVGKSRLLEFARAEAGTAGIPVGSVTADRYGSSIPYGAMRELIGKATGTDVQDLGGRIRATGIEDGGLLVSVLGLASSAGAPDESDDADPAAVRYRVQRAAAQFLSSAVPGPRLLVVDDAYWADDASLDVLDGLASCADQGPWVLLLSFRPTDDRRHRLTAMAPMIVSPLDGTQGAELAHQLADGLLGPDRIAAVVHRAAGNPLFLEELVRATLLGADLSALPESVEGVISAQLDELAPPDRSLVRYAAVAGQTFAADLVADATGHSLPPGWWRSLDSVLTEQRDGHLSFRHPLIRDTAYAGLPYRARRAIHGHIGAVLESRGAEAGLLSAHFTAAADWSRAWRYSRRAGRTAQDRYANAEAVDAYARAVTAAGNLGSVPAAELAEVHERLGLVLDRMGEYDRARRSFTSARRLVEDPVARARLLFCEGQMRARRSELTQALRWYARGLRELDGRDDRAALAQRARLMTGRAQVELNRNRYTAAVAIAEQADLLAARADDEKARALAHTCLYCAHMYLGSAERHRYRDLPADVFERHGYALGLASLLGMTAADDYLHGRWADALAAYDRQAELARQSGYVDRQGEAAANAGEVLADQGRWADADVRLADAVRCLRPSGNRLLLGFALLQQARVRGGLGAFTDGHALLAEAETLLNEAGASEFVRAVRARALELDLADDRSPPEELVTRARAIEATTTETVGGGAAACVALRAAAVAQAGRDQGSGAVAMLGEAVGQARRAGSRYEWAITVDIWCRRAPMLPEGPPADDVARARTIIASHGVVDHILWHIT